MSAELRAWVDKVNSLQMSSEIRELLIAEGVKGFRGTTVSCPLANLFSIKGNVGLVDVTAGRIAFNEAYVNIAGVKEYRFAFIKPSTAVRLFIARFDRGEYPELTLS